MSKHHQENKAHEEPKQNPVVESNDQQEAAQHQDHSSDKKQSKAEKSKAESERSSDVESVDAMNRRNAAAATHLTPEQIEESLNPTDNSNKVKGIYESQYLQEPHKAFQMPGQVMAPVAAGVAGMGGYKGLDFAKLEQINQKIENDKEFAAKFDENAQEALKAEGFNLPEGMKMSGKKDQKGFEVRVGNIVISE